LPCRLAQKRQAFRLQPRSSLPRRTPRWRELDSNLRSRRERRSRGGRAGLASPIAKMPPVVATQEIASRSQLHSVSSRAGEGERNSRFFGCIRSSASRRISFSNVFLPNSRCSSRTRLCKPRYSDAGHHLLGGAHRRQPTLGVKPPPAEQLVRCNAMPARHQRHRHPRRVGLLHDCCLLFRRPAPPPLNRRNHLNSIDRPSHRHRHTPGA